MFAGHLAAAFVGKRIEPNVSLGVLIAAAFGLDLVWPILLLTGAETVVVDPGNTAFTGFDFQSYPWSHSLAAVVLWSVVAGWLAARLFNRRGAGWVTGLLVLSHWALDFLMHRPDLPLWPAGPEVGLGLWNSIAGTIMVEGALLVGSIWIYLKMTRATDAVGRWALWALVALVVVMWLSFPLSPPLPNTTAIAMVTLALWVLVPWGQWIDRHRAPVGNG